MAPTFLQGASSHDGNRNYKQQADEQQGVINDQRDIINQLSSLLEAYGYHLPAVRTYDRAHARIDSSRR